MGGATKSRFAVVFLMILTLGVSLGLRAEDVLETAYDESETLPYEVVPGSSIVVPRASARIAKAELNRGSVLHFDSLTKRCKLHCENSAQSHSVPDSLTIINRSLRC